MSTEPTPDDTTQQGIRRPGQWPVPRSFEDPEPDRRHTAIQARFVITLNAFRVAVEEQPTPTLARALLRRWINAATAITEDVISAMPDQNKEGGK